MNLYCLCAKVQLNASQQGDSFEMTVIVVVGAVEVVDVEEEEEEMTGFSGE
jgi:hypothetical protein